MTSKYNENLKDVFSSCVMKFDKNDAFYTKLTNVKKKKKNLIKLVFILRAWYRTTKPIFWNSTFSLKSLYTFTKISVY